MVDDEIVGAGITNPRVIFSMRNTPRHEFVPVKLIDRAYFDMSLPIGEHQTISPPLMVAYESEELDPQTTMDCVFEIGTGSGYQTAVLSSLVKEVYTIEIVESLGRHAERTLKRPQVTRMCLTRSAIAILGWPGACTVRQDYRHLLAGKSSLEAAHRLGARTAAGWSFPWGNGISKFSIC